MYQHRTIYIVKTDQNKRQVKYANFALDEFQELEEAKEFAKSYEHWETVEIRDDDILIEEFRK